ncbi:MAG: FAD-dependent monooxygenase [Actinomycetota bacterium]|nr:FAD-dependent monooxygenase [Actinomycetota bacterium]
MKVIIVGGGPVACLVARRLRERQVDVRIYERGPDPRLPQAANSHSFNLTLTQRGLVTLDPALRATLYDNGVVLPQRVIHHADGALTYQPYSLNPDHHLLSIPRGVLHRTLLTEAERAGAEVFFGHECVRSDPLTASVRMVFDGTVIEDEADLLIGCDGANSTVRHDISRRGGRLEIRQEFIPHGYLEMRMPADACGGYSLLNALQDPLVPASGQHGLHVWPRGDFMLLSQPNRDTSYTTTMFMPLRRQADDDRPSIERMRTPADVHALFADYFPDAIPFLPSLIEEFFSAPPASLRTITCDPFHYGRAVLMGDAAHTVVPFYGQGINCSFEDVGVFFGLFDAAANAAGEVEDVPDVLAEFTKSRKQPTDAVAALSLANLRELTASTDKGSFHGRNRLERELHATYPDHFAPVYHLVAFSNLPYHHAMTRYERERKVIDDLCSRYDAITEQDTIVRLFGEHIANWQGASELVTSGRDGGR